MCDAGQEGTPDKQLQKQKAWENAREIIRNENDVIIHRTTAFLAIQGFLFTVLVLGSVGLAGESNKDFRLLLSILLLIVSIVGICSACLILPLIQVATRQVATTKEWWNKLNSDFDSYSKQHPFPCIIGENECYNSLDLDDSAKERIRAEPKIMLSLDKVLRSAWIFIFIIFLGIVVFQSKSCYESACWQPWAISPIGTKDVTKIIITEDQNNKKVSISFEGELGKIPDLEKRIKAIP